MSATPMRVAAVDCGSNSTRLLVADLSPDGPLHTVDRRMEVTRLGAGVDATGQLDPRAIDRTLAVLEGYAAAWKAHGVEAVRVAATSAVRDAGNRDRFVEAVRERVGAEVTVLSGAEEAAATYRGATTSVAVGDTALVVDIGGGSTELVTPDGSVSLQIGCVRLTERCLGGDPPTPDEYGHAVALVDDLLDSDDAAAIRAWNGVARRQTLVAVAGTATTLAALALELDRYEPDAIHGTVLSTARICQLVEDLAWIPAARRAALGPIVPGREDVIVAGGIILARILARLGYGKAVISEADILDGLAMSLGE